MNKITKTLLLAFSAAVLSTSCNEMANQQLKSVQNQVAEDAVKQYDIAKRQGDKVQIYVQAQMVAAAYLQAQDEANYNKWKEIEKEAAKDAGMPQ